MSVKNNYRISNWWWENLSSAEKKEFKKIHDIELNNPDTRYVDLKDSRYTRISKLSDGQISSIHRTSNKFYDSIKEFWEVYDFKKSTRNKLVKK